MAIWLEWISRNQPGRIQIDEQGIHCTLPWKRQRFLQWDDVREVRCIARQLHHDFSFWEIRGRTPSERVSISWQLKGYQDLLWTVKRYAIHCERFDDITS